MTRMTSAILGLLAVAACGPGDARSPDAAIADAAMREAAVYPDAAPPLDGDLTDRPTRDYNGPATCNDPFDSPTRMNDSRETATPLTRQSFAAIGAGICSDGDVDFYTVTPRPGDKFAVQIDFTHYDGDLILDLLTPDGSLMQRSDTSSFARGNEALLMPAATELKYFIRVSARRGDDRVPYSLRLDYLIANP